MLENLKLSVIIFFTYILIKAGHILMWSLIAMITRIHILSDIRNYTFDTIKLYNTTVPTKYFRCCKKKKKIEKELLIPISYYLKVFCLRYG